MSVFMVEVGGSRNPHLDNILGRFYDCCWGQIPLMVTESEFCTFQASVLRGCSGLVPTNNARGTKRDKKEGSKDHENCHCQ